MPAAAPPGHTADRYKGPKRERQGERYEGTRELGDTFSTFGMFSGELRGSLQQCNKASGHLHVVEAGEGVVVQLNLPHGGQRGQREVGVVWGVRTGGDESPREGAIEGKSSQSSGVSGVLHDAGNARPHPRHARRERRRWRLTPVQCQRVADEIDRRGCGGRRRGRRRSAPFGERKVGAKRAPECGWLWSPQKTPAGLRQRCGLGRTHPRARALRRAPSS